MAATTQTTLYLGPWYRRSPGSCRTPRTPRTPRRLAGVASSGRMEPHRLPDALELDGPIEVNATSGRSEASTTS